MDTALVIMIVLFVAGIALGFYMDWFGLWVTEEERKEQINRSKQSMEELKRQSALSAAAGARPAKPEHEPVHGWTERQLNDYLARNPAYRPTYAAELQKHKQAQSARIDG